MNIKNYEFKARVYNIEEYERKLLALSPVFHGVDYQIDTYFNTQKGRLKLREGNIENSLIQYEREDVKGAKESQIVLYPHQPSRALKDILLRQFGVKAIVEKKRKIYFIGNVKFHFDLVEGLGTFIEVEAIGKDETSTTEELKLQCDRYFNLFGLTKDNFVDKSYSDLILEASDK